MFGFTSDGWLHDEVLFPCVICSGYEIKIQYYLQISKFIYFYDLALLPTPVCPIHLDILIDTPVCPSHLDILIDTPELIDLEQFIFYSRYFVPEISLF